VQKGEREYLPGVCTLWRKEWKCRYSIIFAISNPVYRFSFR